MDELKTDFEDGDDLHAADVNKFNRAVNDLADTRPLRAAFRPLRSTDAVVAAMTSVIATGASAATTEIGWAAAAGKYRFASGPLTAFEGDASLGINNNGTFGPTYQNYQPIVVEFWTNATDVRAIGYQIGKPDMWALVDDQRLRPTTWQHANFSDSYFTWTITQGGAVWRKFRLSIMSTLYSISINSGATIIPTTKGFQLAVPGDSYVSGIGPINNAVSSGTAGAIFSGSPLGEFEQEAGIDVIRCGVPGTGYINQQGFGAAGRFGSTQRMAKLAALGAMDAVLMFGSVNDAAETSGDLVTACNAAWTAAKVAQPNASLIVAGMENFGIASSPIDALNAAMKAAAIAHDDVDAFVDLRAASIMTGTGKDGTAVGNGNSDVFLASDATHTTHLGARHWGQHLHRLLGQVAIKTPTAA